MHWIELPRLAHAIDSAEEPELVNWGKFLKADSDEELEELAMSDPNIREAKQALDHLSADPTARALAEERHRALHFYQEDMELAREEGMRRGRIEMLCEMLDVSIDGARRQHLDRLDAAILDSLLEHLRTHRRWPDS